MERAVRVMEGVFLGGRQAAQNTRFLRSNKIALIINCAPFEVPTQYSRAFSFECDLNVSDALHRNYLEITALVESSLEKAEGVLIHCATGVSRCVGVFAAFLMCKFQWRLSQTLEWLYAVYPYTDIEPLIVTQLIRLQSDKLQSRKVPCNEEVLLLNTASNIKAYTTPVPHTPRQSRQKVAWADLSKNFHMQSRTGKVASLKSILKGGPRWKSQVSRRTDSGSTLDSAATGETIQKPGKAFLIGLAKSCRCS